MPPQTGEEPLSAIVRRCAGAVAQTEKDHQELAVRQVGQIVQGRKPVVDEIRFLGLPVLARDEGGDHHGCPVIRHFADQLPGVGVAPSDHDFRQIMPQPSAALGERARGSAPGELLQVDGIEAEQER